MRLRSVRFPSLASAIVSIVGAVPAHGAPPRHIVSVNLCTDQLIVALADRGQIAAVSRNATDPLLSAAAVQARGLPRIGASREQLLALAPDLVIGMPAPRDLAIAPRRVLDLAPANSYAEIVAQVRQVAAAVGHADRGEALIARMDRALAAVPKAGRGKVAAYYQRRGFLTGGGTLVDDLMGRLGFVNLARRLDRPALSYLPLETLIAARPDYLIVESESVRVADQGTEMLQHPALRSIPRLHVPQSWTVCGGPAYVLAARSLARQIGGR